MISSLSYELSVLLRVSINYYDFWLLAPLLVSLLIEIAVTGVKLACEAMSIILKKKHKLDIILADAELADLDVFELLHMAVDKNVPTICKYSIRLQKHVFNMYNIFYPQKNV